MNEVLVHHLFVVNARINTPPTDEKFIIKWKKDLVNKIGMKILRGPIAVYSDMPGNAGLTAVTIIETSHIALHIWDEVKPAILRLDVYSCAEFNIADILNSIKQFGVESLDYKFLDRTGDSIQEVIPI